MQFRRAVQDRDAQVVQALLELYLHDMAEWFRFDIGEDGTYSYDLSQHWADGEPVYLAEVDERPAGFVLVSREPPSDFAPAGNTFDMEEFFIVRRHRHVGASDAFANYVFDTHDGNWLVRVFEANLPALPFWRRVVAARAGTRFRAERLKRDGHGWTHFHFGPDH